MAGSTTVTEPVANRRVGIPLVLMAGIFWSLSGLVYRWIEVATAWQVLFYRSLSLFCFIALWLVVRYRGRLVGVFQSAGRLSVLGGLCLSISFSGYILALDQTSVANALFILAAAPFFAALLGRVLLSEHIGWTTSLAMGIAALGLAVMAGNELAIGRGLGELFALAAALGLAGLTITLRMRRSTDMLPAILFASLFATLFALTGMLWDSDSLILTPKDLSLSISLGVFQVGLGFMLYTAGSRHLPAVELTLLSLTEVIVGPILAWLGADEVPSVTTLAGGALILLAIVTLAMLGQRHQPAKTPP
ncbi:MAG: protein LicB [Gammaproteobacteria bacterium]|nr:MAG: protein LicB [Gammaproteobacteria bacterium]